MLSWATVPFCVLGFALSAIAQTTSPAAQGTSAGAGADSPTYLTISLVPNGVLNNSYTGENTIPWPCVPGCYAPAGSYYACFGINPLASPDQTVCDNYLCNATTYGQLSACLNCIVANGNERPFGYYTNTAAVYPTSTRIGSLGPPVNPNGPIDLSEANKILANVTERCASRGKSFGESSTVTATPTTTGPYYLSYSAGATVSVTQWTGLETYSQPLVISAALNNTVRSSSPTSSSAIASSRAASSAASATSSAVPAATSRSADRRSRTPASLSAAWLALTGAGVAAQWL